MRTIKITPSFARRAVFTLVALFIAGMGVWYASDATTRAKNIYVARAAAMEAAGGGKLLTGTWIEYNAGLFEQARKENKIIVMDFTAEWCINCKVLKGTVLERDPVKSEFAKSDVVLFTVDLTSDEAAGWKTLEQMGETGIPLLVIYTPGNNTPWKSNAYTPAQVMTAVSSARNAASTLTQAPATTTTVTPAKQGV
jgi:thiol:disulfide interchange protein DsbD